MGHVEFGVGSDALGLLALQISLLLSRLGEAAPLSMAPWETPQESTSALGLI